MHGLYSGFYNVLWGIKLLHVENHIVEIRRQQLYHLLGGSVMRVKYIHKGSFMVFQTGAI